MTFRGKAGQWLKLIAPRVVDRQVVLSLEFAHAEHQGHAFGNQLQELGVEGVDFAADGLEVRLVHHPAMLPTSLGQREFLRAARSASYSMNVGQPDTTWT